MAASGFSWNLRVVLYWRGSVTRLGSFISYSILKVDPATEKELLMEGLVIEEKHSVCRMFHISI